jgi:uncharacterized phiE125 gp8 family phage protein
VNLIYGDWSECVKGTRALITAPTAAVISATDVKTALGISGTTQDGIINAALATVIGQLDPATGGWLGRALRPQTWELRLHGFPNRGIQLPFPPLISVTSLKYDDTSGVEQTLVENTGFRVLGIGTKGKQVVAPLYNQIWPNARSDAESVRIRFQSGYAATPPDTLPAAITHAICLGVRMLLSDTAQNLYVSLDRVEGVGEKRYIVSTAANELLTGAMENLLSVYRVYG